MRAISPEGVALARQHAKDRGWRETGRFAVLEPAPSVRATTIQNGDVDLNGEGRILVWDWENPNTTVTSGTVIIETYSPSTSTTFDMEYFVDDYYGYTTYTRFIEGRDRDGHFTRATYQPEPPGSTGVRLVALAMPQGCAEGRAWRQCMRDCLSNKLNNSLWAAAGGVIGGAKACAGFAGQAGAGGPFVSLGVFLGCEVGAGAIAGSMALIYNFGVQESCDGGGNCGMKPSCQ